MKEIQRVSVTDSVVENIKEMINSGEFQPNDKLPTESTMGENMKVSRTCIREAMRVLQALGMVDIRPGKGAFVASPLLGNTDDWYNVEDAQFYDFMEVRMAIETISTRLAIKQATHKQLEKLEKIQESFIEANNNQNLTQLVMLDELFHTEIVNMTGNQLLVRINKQLVTANRKYRCESFMNSEVYNKAIVPHNKVLECFKKHDSEQGQKEMYEHLKITKSDMEHIFHSKHN